MNTLRKNVIDDHSLTYYNNCKLVSFEDKENSGLEFYNLNELQNIDKDWFPLCCYIDKDTKELVYGGKSKVVHTYVEGETGCGKTTKICIQSINALSHMKNQPSFIVIDPFGEICENTYYNFKKLGYNVRILNCDNPNLSDTYNPFNIIAKEVLEAGYITDKASQRIKRIAQILCPVTDATQPIWEIGACAYINGLILDLFEDLLNNEIKAEDINLYNIVQRHYWLRREIMQNFSKDLFAIDHYDKKGPLVLSTQKLISVTNNADRTRDSYFGVVENHIDKINQEGIYKLSSNCNIMLDELIDKPTVIFIQSGASSIGEDLASILIDDLYNIAEKRGRESFNKRLSRNVHVFFDEFANYSFGTGEDYIRMLTTSRKFGLYWHMYLQCDAQLDKKFNSREIGAIIRANATEIFMGSQDYRTIERFSDSCGARTIESLNSKLYQTDVVLESVPLVSISKLLDMNEGYMYIKINKEPVLYTYFEAFYNCKEFVKYENINELYPMNEFDYKSTLTIPGQKKETQSSVFDFFGNKKVSNYEDLLRRKATYVKTDSGNKIVVLDLNKEETEELEDADILNYFDYLDEDELILVEQSKNNEIQNKIDNYSQFYLDPKINEQIMDKIDVLKDVSCVPDILIEAVENPSKSEFLFDPLFKYDIIKKFISDKDIRDKESSNSKLEFEVKYLEAVEVFPDFVQDCFNDALETYKILDLSDIEELRKINGD